MVFFKNVEAVNDFKNKLSLDENSVIQWVCMYMIHTFYCKTNKLFKEFCFLLLFSHCKKLAVQVLKTTLKEY